MDEERVFILKQALVALKRQAEVVTKSYPAVAERLPDRKELVDAYRALKAVGFAAEEVAACSFALRVSIHDLSEEAMLEWFEGERMRCAS